MVEVISRDKPRPSTDIYLLEGWGAREDIFHNRFRFRQASNIILAKANLHKIGLATTKAWKGHGWSYTADLSESIVAGGTWEEYNRYVYYLFHTCAPGLDLSNLGEIVKDIMRCREVEFNHLFSKKRVPPISFPDFYTSGSAL